jgi:hypothetical protein
MAHTIRLKYGPPSGWSYLYLTDADHGNVDYYPRTAGQDDEEITESGRWRVAGSSASDLITHIRAIEQLFARGLQPGRDWGLPGVADDAAGCGG